MLNILIIRLLVDNTLELGVSKQRFVAVSRTGKKKVIINEVKLSE